MWNSVALLLIFRMHVAINVGWCDSSKLNKIHHTSTSTLQLQSQQHMSWLLYQTIWTKWCIQYLNYEIAYETVFIVKNLLETISVFGYFSPVLWSLQHFSQLSCCPLVLLSFFRSWCCWMSHRTSPCWTKALPERSSTAFRNCARRWGCLKTRVIHNTRLMNLTI